MGENGVKSTEEDTEDREENPWIYLKNTVDKAAEGSVYMAVKLTLFYSAMMINAHSLPHTHTRARICDQIVSLYVKYICIFIHIDIKLINNYY